jgi:plastocyanin
MIKYLSNKAPFRLAYVVFFALLMVACKESTQTSEYTVASDSVETHQHRAMATQKADENTLASTVKTEVNDQQKESTPTQIDNSSSARVQKIVIKTVEYQLVFDQELITIKAGTPVEIEFINVDEMPHNLLIIKPGSLERVGEAADKMASDPQAAKIHFVPQTSDVLYATPLLMIDQTYTLRFTAPKEPGDYPYVCTYPGHWRTMKGIMKVIK